MSPLPLVSVVIPFYNVERYIAYAVGSVLKQTYQNLEIVLVDDGSLDNSLEICQGFQDDRIKIIRQSNMGLAAARNTGILNSSGEFVALLDSDDAMMPDKLERHLQHLMTNPDVGLSYAGALLINDDNKSINIFQTPQLGPVGAQLVFCGKVILNGSIPVFRKEALMACMKDNNGRMGCFDESLRRSEDVEFWTRFALTSKFKIEGILGHLTQYRITRQGLSADIEKQLASWEAVLEKIRLLDPGFIEQNGDMARALELRYLARRAFQMQDGKQGLSLILRSLRQSPSLLIKEPRKTIITFCGCVVLAFFPEIITTRLLKLSRVNLEQVVTGDLNDCGKGVK
jgi:glycosyltransferase involved in cell wall biosynthesis